jgi:hypothetical protein
MNLAQINSDVTFLTGAGTGLYLPADRLINLNSWYHKVSTMILNSQDGWDFDDSNKSDFPILTADLKANQQDYALPVNAYKIKRIEVSYDGVKWYKAEPFDIGERGKGTSTTDIANDFTQSEPKYDIQGGSIILYPIPPADKEECLKIWIAREVTEFSSTDVTNGTLEPGFDEPFHRMISIGMSLDWAVAKNLPVAGSLSALLTDYEARLRQFFGKKEEPGAMVLKGVYISYE